jgi:hypothetical protein
MGVRSFYSLVVGVRTILFSKKVIHGYKVFFKYTRKLLPMLFACANYHFATNTISYLFIKEGSLFVLVH